MLERLPETDQSFDLDPREETGRLLAMAVVLARKGRYADASKALQEALDAGDCTEPQALDLQAKIYAQQGYYIHAESCWNKARQLNGGNTAYENAISQLRQSRPSFGRLVQAAIMILLACVLGILVWNSVFVARTIMAQQVAVEKSLRGIRTDISVFSDTADKRNQELVKIVSGVNDGVVNLDTRLCEGLNALPSKASTVEFREALLSHFDGRTDILRKKIEESLNSLNSRSAEDAARQVQKSESLASTIGKVSNQTVAIEDKLAKSLGIQEELLRRTKNDIPNSLEAMPMNEAVLKLTSQLAEIEATLKLIVPSTGQHPTGDKKAAQEMKVKQ